MEEKKEWKKKIPMWIKEGLFEEVTDDRGTRILGYVNCSDKVLDFIEQEIDKAREEGEIEVLTEIFQTCYQEDSKTLELVEEKLSKLKDNKRYGEERTKRKAN